jgi:hypothetical protein
MSPPLRGPSLPVWHRWLIGSSLLLLVASLMLNLLLARALYDAFIKVHFSRIYPAGFSDVLSASATEVAPPGRETIELWGDSRAYLWDTRSLEPQWRVVKFAHGGQTSSQVLLQLEETSQARVSCAVLEVGINDLHPLGALGEYRQAIVEHLKANLLEIRDFLKRRADRLVLAAIFPPAHVPISRYLTWDPRTLQTITAINDFIRDAADGDRVQYFDANFLLRDGDGYLQAPYVDPDFFLHLRKDGYQQLNPEVSRLCSRAARANPGQ